MKAWLHRRQKSIWVFEWSDKYQAFVHTTSRGTMYAILRDQYKPFWIGRLFPDANDSMSAVKCEDHLRATFIDFENGGRYYFPGGEK
jgi:hypothetical protein